MSNSDDILRQFIQDHRITVLDTSKRAHIRRNTSFNFFNSPTDMNSVVSQQGTYFETEPLYTIEISKSELDKIAYLESQIMNHAKGVDRYNLFYLMVQQKEKEKMLCEKYPSVQRAFEQYSLVLKLAESGEL